MGRRRRREQEAHAETVAMSAPCATTASSSSTAGSTGSVRAKNQAKLNTVTEIDRLIIKKLLGKLKRVDTNTAITALVNPCGPVNGQI